MRRVLIRHVLPLIFCAIPVLAGILVAVALPEKARRIYLEKISTIDYLILGLGACLFVAQLAVSWRALQWRGSNFDLRADAWLTSLAQAAEWFPLLGLLGTVAGILQTFGYFEGQTEPKTSDIIARYAPAITATGSGLLMALVNIFPTWIVIVGRQMITALGGKDPAAARSAASSQV
jgi:hypothetical protein